MASRTIWLSVAAWLAGIAGVAGAAQNEKLVSQITPAERHALAREVALSAPSLEEIELAAAPDAIRKRTEEILALGSLAPSVREVDAEGRASIHRYLRQRIAALAASGLREVGALRGTVAVPVSLDRLSDPAQREPAASLAVGERSWPVLPFWPNGALPTLCPKQGLSGPLVFVGAGTWEDVQGLDLSGAIALMTFEGGRNWERLFMLGARAVVAIEDEHVNRFNATGLFCNSPVPFPRFYASRAAGEELKALAARRATGTDGATPVTAGAAATLRGGNRYENRPVESLFAYLPPTEPRKYTVRETDLAERIAISYGLTVDALLKENRLASADLKPGQKLDIPGRVEPYEVRKEDLLTRLADEYGVPKDVLLAENGLTNAELKPGQTLTIPNVDDAVALVCRLDSVCAVPDAPHGAGVAANLASTLAIMDHLAASEHISRRRGVLFAFLDGDNYGGRASRALAEALLRDRGELKAAISRAEEAGSGMLRFFAILGCTVAMTLLSLLAVRVMAKRRREGAPPRPWLAPVIVSSAAVVGLTVGILLPLKQGAAAEQSTEEARIEQYRAALAWFAAPEKPLQPAETARWLAEQWLNTRFERVRVDLAEARIKVIAAHQSATDPAERERLAASIRDSDARIRLLADVRNKTYGHKQKTMDERLLSFHRRLSEPETAAPMQQYGLSLAHLVARLKAELDEESAAQDTIKGNLKLAKALLALMHTDPKDRQKRANQPVLGWWMNLGDGSTTLSTRDLKDQRGIDLPAGNAVKGTEPRLARIAAYAASTAGWPEDWTFIGSEYNPEFIVTATGLAPSYAELLLAANLCVAPLGPVNDRRIRLDTPRDTLEHVDFAKLAVLTRTALLFVKAGVENPANAPNVGKIPKVQEYGRLVGSVVQFNIRSGIDAQDPVPNACVYYPALVKGLNEPEFARNTAALLGTRPGILQTIPLSGAFIQPVESLAFHKKNSTPCVYGFRLNRETALFDMVMDQAAIGTQRQTPGFALLAGRDVEKKLVLTPVYPLTFFAGVDPMGYAAIPDPKARDASAIRIVDAVLNGAPRHYATEAPVIHYGERELDSVIAYVPVGRRIRVMIEDRGATKALLVGAMGDDADDKGAGYPVGPGADADPAVSLPRTPLLIARDMQHVAERRHRQYHDYGIRNQAIQSAIARSSEKLALAEKLAGEKDWRAAIGAARECWGILIKNYPSVMRLGREAVFSVVVLMAILVPAALFLERLLIGAKSIINQLLGATALFVVGTLFLKFFHPAFEIAVSPFIVMIAFVMILMSVIVMSISYQRFDVLVRRARIAGGEVESEEISLASSLATALSLGVSNLKKRPARTALTAFTVSVLSFSIITFVSVRGRDTVLRKKIALDTDVEGAQVAPQAPKYEGILFRGQSWAWLDEAFLSAVNTEYGKAFDITRRAAYVETAGGNNADTEGKNQVEVAYGKKSKIVNAVMALEPNETRFTGLNAAVSRGAWFEAENPAAGKPGDRFHVILPDNVAEGLGIKESDLFDAAGARKADKDLPEVTMRNLKWRVVGILNTEQADRVRDVNGKSVAVVDYVRSGITPNAVCAIESEARTYHMTWKRLALVPVAARKDVGANWASMAIRFTARTDVKGFLRDISLRLNNTMFGHMEGQLSLLTTRKKTSVGGLAKVIVPIILCILIVANTMLGTVDERRAEVEMLGAVGLSPAQISFLLLSEASVFSTLGIIFGMFTGLAFSKTMLNYPEMLRDLSFNFTSLTSTFLAMSTGLIVLIATLVPARRAAAMAAPSGMGKWVLPPPEEGGLIRFGLPFTLTQGNAVGMLAFFRRFLLNHTEATSQDFNCRQIQAAIGAGAGDSLELRARMWLAPYDLDVAQQMRLAILPTENAGVFRASLDLHRTSGTEESWLRTNYAFMDLVRYQFLLWRNLDSGMRKRYIAEGADLLRGAPPPAETAGTGAAGTTATTTATA
jgi:LysM repeat protein